MKRLIIAMLVVGAAISGVLAAQPFEGVLRDTGDLGAGYTVYQRYFSPVEDKVNANLAAGCPQGTDANLRACLMTWRSKNSIYRGMSDDVFNYDNASGNQYYMVLDAQSGAGTSGHQGFYAWVGKVVTAGDQGNPLSADCVTTPSTLSCFGPANDASATSYDLTSVPGTVVHHGGLRPIPVPTVVSYNKVTGDINLSWRAADPLNATAAPTYKLYYFTTAATSGSCGSAPTDAQFTSSLPADVSGTTTTVNVSALGLSPGAEQCATFAIALHFGDAALGANNPPAGNKIYTKFVSSNGQAVYLGAGGLSSGVTDVKAVYAGRNTVAVSWKSTDEQGVSGYQVWRALQVDGNYEKVSGLIAATGSGAYTYMDVLSAPNTRLAASGLYYKVETVSPGNKGQMSAPVKATLGAEPAQAAPRHATTKK